jgi:hypothetical protein
MSDEDIETTLEIVCSCMIFGHEAYRHSTAVCHIIYLSKGCRIYLSNVNKRFEESPIFYNTTVMNRLKSLSWTTTVQSGGDYHILSVLLYR